MSVEQWRRCIRDGTVDGPVNSAEFPQCSGDGGASTTAGLDTVCECVFRWTLFVVDPLRHPSHLSRASMVEVRASHCRYFAARYRLHLRSASPGGSADHPTDDSPATSRSDDDGRCNTRTFRLTRQIGAVARQPGYNRARTVWNAVVDRQPRVIVRCSSVRDVVTAIRTATEHGLEIGIKCGGHSAAGHAVPDGGLMIDLTPLRAVRVDPGRRTAVVEGGALLGALDRPSSSMARSSSLGQRTPGDDV